MVIGNHYYLPDKTYNALLELYKADGFPFYVIFNKEHKLIHQILSFPGASTMQQWLRESVE